MNESAMSDLQIDVVIFDLSEVLIRGLFGIEKVLAKKLNIPETRCFQRLQAPSCRHYSKARSQRANIWIRSLEHRDGL